MSPASITSSTFTLAAPGGIAVAGTVAYSGMVATFTPSAPLANDTTYTATITNGAQTPGGASLLGNYAWTFTTAVLAPPPVPAVVSVTPASGSTNVAAASALTATFSQAMTLDSLQTAFSVAAPGNVAVPGTVTLSANGLTATFMPSAALAPSTTYTATISTAAADTSGTTLPAPYVWTFTTITPPPAVISTVPSSNATGVPVDQTLAIRFNEAMLCSTLTSTSPAATITLTGPGAMPVAVAVTCAGNQANVKPAAALAFNTTYTATVSTAAEDLAGTPMQSPYQWSFQTLPAPPLSPVVIATVPLNGAVGVPVDQALSVTFNEAMDPATINSATFLLTAAGGAQINGVITYVAAGSVATFKPSTPLAYDTQYTATLTAGAMDLNDDAALTPYSFTFTTANAPIVIPPTVTSTDPVTSPENTNVPVNQVVTADFSVPMNPATISAANFTLTAAGSTTPVAGLLAYAAIGNQLVFLPAANLAPDTVYTATITTGVQSLSGTSLASNYTWIFQTSAASNTTAPELVTTVPANGATNVPVNQAVSVTFSEAMNPLSITNATFQLTQAGVAVPATITYDPVNFIATLTPTAPLTAGASYIANVTSGATSLSGIPLGTTGAPNPWDFTTSAAIVPPPVVLGPTIALFGSFGGGAGITNQGTLTVVNGDIGTTGASTTMTGFYDNSVLVGGLPQCTYTVTGANYGMVTGTINTAPPSPTVACPNEGTASTMAIATQAALEAQTAYTTLQNLPPGTTLATNELGNRILAPGTYTSSSFYTITTGPLTLDAQGDPNATWVFQMGSYLQVGTPTTPESVILINGAQAKNVYWQVGGLPGAVINYGGGGTMVGTILSSPGITVSSPGVAAVTTINGRVLALHASVTMVNTVINVPAP